MISPDFCSVQNPLTRKCLPIFPVRVGTLVHCKFLSHQIQHWSLGIRSHMVKSLERDPLSQALNYFHALQPMVRYFFLNKTVRLTPAIDTWWYTQFKLAEMLVRLILKLNFHADGDESVLKMSLNFVQSECYFLLTFKMLYFTLIQIIRFT